MPWSKSRIALEQQVEGFRRTQLQCGPRFTPLQVLSKQSAITAVYATNECQNEHREIAIRVRKERIQTMCKAGNRSVYRLAKHGWANGLEWALCTRPLGLYRHTQP